MVEAVIVIPVAMLVVLLAVQACLWAHAAALVQTAAAEGDETACDLGGSAHAGVDRSRQFLTTMASSSVVNASVSSSEPVAGEIEIDVRATAGSILPWIHLPVSASRRGTIQEFRSSE